MVLRSLSTQNLQDPLDCFPGGHDGLTAGGRDGDLGASRPGTRWPRVGDAPRSLAQRLGDDQVVFGNVLTVRSGQASKAGISGVSLASTGVLTEYPLLPLPQGLQVFVNL